MKVVWERGALTVRDVYEELRPRRRIVYTTVMTMMNVLETKRHLRKHPDGRPFVYRAARPKKKVIGAMVREFLNRVFGGSAERLLVHLLEDRRLSREDLE